MGKTFEALEKYLKTKDSPGGYNAGTLDNPAFRMIKPGHSNNPQPKNPEKLQDSHVKNAFDETANDPMDRFEQYKLLQPIAKQIVLNLKTSAIQNIVKYKYFLVLHGHLKYTNGELLVAENQYFYRLNFKSKAILPMLLDRQGDLKNFLQKSNNPVACRNSQAVPSHILNTDEIRQFELTLIRNMFNAADKDSVKEILGAIFDLTFYDEIECRDGKMVVLNGAVAYELLIDVNFGFSIFIDEYGTFIDVAAADDPDVSQKVVEDYLIHQSWFPSMNIFKKQKAEFDSPSAARSQKLRRTHRGKNI
jgi:hypothetical protein